jgi:hypothetical protein
MKNQEQPVETVQPIMLDHQPAERPIGHVGTLEDFNQTILNSVGENLSLITHRLMHRLSHHVLK